MEYVVGFPERPSQLTPFLQRGEGEGEGRGRETKGAEEEGGIDREGE